MSDKMLDIHGLEHLWQRFLGLFLPRDEAPTKLSEFDNDVGYITEPDMDDATGVLAVEHGGTGSYSPIIGCHHLQATRWLIMNRGDANDVWGVIAKMDYEIWQAPGVINILFDGTIMNLYTNGQITNELVGMAYVRQKEHVIDTDYYTTYFSGIVTQNPQLYYWGRVVVLMANGQITRHIVEVQQSGTADSGIDAISFNGSNVPPDASKRVSLTETDPTVPAWAKAPSKPGYTAAEVGAVDKTGDTMTGPLNIGADIVQTDGYIKGTANDGINHAIKLGHYDDNVMEFNEYGGLFNFYRNAASPRELVFQINMRSGASAAPLSIGSGGTQASDTAGARANLSVPYTSRGIFLSSFSDIPTEEGMYTVAYSGTDANAPLQTSWAWWWNVIQIGPSTRLTQIAFSPYRERDCAFMRVKHDNTWYGWFKFQGTAV